MVRGARTVRLRRGLDLPPISLSEFAGVCSLSEFAGVRCALRCCVWAAYARPVPAGIAPAALLGAFVQAHSSPPHPIPHPIPHPHPAGIVTSDAAQQQPLGIMHLLAGVQAAAAQHWNESHPDTSLGLVALELEFSPRGAALLAAPGPGGSPRRLKVRPVKPGVIELVPRDAPTAHSGAHDSAVALQSSDGATTEGAWPLTSVSPMQLQVRWLAGSRTMVAVGCQVHLDYPSLAAAGPCCSSTRLSSSRV